MMTDLSEERERGCIFASDKRPWWGGGSCSFGKKEGKANFLNVCECEIQIGTTQQNSSK
jgi:hypothetical protein